MKTNANDGFTAEILVMIKLSIALDNKIYGASFQPVQVVHNVVIPACTIWMIKQKSGAVLVLLYSQNMCEWSNA